MDARIETSGQLRKIWEKEVAIAKLLEAPEYGEDFVCRCIVFARLAGPYDERTLLGGMIERKYLYLAYEHLQRGDDALLRKVIKCVEELKANKAPWLKELEEQICRLGEAAKAAGLLDDGVAPDGGDNVVWN